jgi:hypothetical protein
MKTNNRKKVLKFGGFITAAHDASESQLTERYVKPTMPLAAFPVRIISKLRAAIASHVPVGYEDETGFHYSANAGDGLSLFFTDNNAL